MDYIYNCYITSDGLESMSTRSWNKKREYLLFLAYHLQ